MRRLLRSLLVACALAVCASPALATPILDGVLPQAHVGESHQSEDMGGIGSLPAPCLDVPSLSQIGHQALKYHPLPPMLQQPFTKVTQV